VFGFVLLNATHSHKATKARKRTIINIEDPDPSGINCKGHRGPDKGQKGLREDMKKKNSADVVEGRAGVTKKSIAKPKGISTI